MMELQTKAGDEVRVRSSSYEGTRQRIAGVSGGLTGARLAEQVHRQQFMTSRNGRWSAHARTIGSFTLIDHNALGTLPGRYRSVRLLYVSADAVRMWACPVRGQSGIYTVRADEVTLEQPLEVLEALQESQDGFLPIGRVVQGEQTERVIITPNLPLEISPKADVSVFTDGSLLVCEPLGDDHFRYLIKDGELVDVARLPLQGEGLVKLLRWHGAYILVVRNKGSHELRLLGDPVHLHEQGAILVDDLMRVSSTAVIEQAWNSPTQSTIALLVRTNLPANELGYYRKLIVGGQTVFSGRFTMGPNDLVWSPAGVAAAARIRRSVRQEDGSVRVEKQIVDRWTERTFDKQSDAVTIHEVVVDDAGHVRGHIIESAGRFYPYVDDEVNDAATFAWNMSMAGSEVSYNRLVGNSIERVCGAPTRPTDQLVLTYP